jgi:hypothetical protein
METCEPIAAAMDVYGLGVTLREVSAGPDRATAGLHDALNQLCATDPARRPSVDVALGLLGAELPADLRPWPEWIDRA